MGGADGGTPSGRASELASKASPIGQRAAAREHECEQHFGTHSDERSIEERSTDLGREQICEELEDEQQRDDDRPDL